MEVFSLLKFWRNVAAGDFDVRNRAPNSDDEIEDEDSFFDLVLTGPDCDFKDVVAVKNNSNVSTTTVDINSFESDKKQKKHHKNTTNNLSKTDGLTKSNTYNNNNNGADVFSIRKVLPIESNFKPQSPISLLRSPPKLRVFMLGFKKEKPESSESMATPPKREQSKWFNMRYTFEEVPVASILGRDNSLRSKMMSERFEILSPESESVKRQTGVQKYLKLIKPLYVRASKIRIFDQSTAVSPMSASSPRKVTDDKQGSRAAGFREACKSLVRNRRTPASTRLPPASTGLPPAPASRRDDSALQQQDGIQSAILHCKRSFSSSSSSSSTTSQECTMLLRCASDSSYQRSFNPPRMSAEEEKRSSI